MMVKNRNSERNDGAHRPWRNRLAWLPVPVLVVTMAVLWAADLRGSYESPYPLIALNFVFSTLVSLFVAYLAARSFLVRGTPGLLLFGCGAILWGMAGTIGAVAAPGNANTGITIHNSCVWLSALCYLASALLSRRPRPSLSPRGVWLLGAYACAAGAVVLISLAALAGWMPVFFVQGLGGTPLRQVVLIWAILMFALTASLLSATGRRPLSPFVYWYALALTLIVTGLCAVTLQSSRGSILGWVGRGAQFLGGVYMLIAAVASVRESRAWGISLESALREEQDFAAAVLDTVGALVVVLDPQGRIVRFNHACERATQYRAAEVLGRPFWDLFVAPEEMEGLKETFGRLAAGQFPIEFENDWVARNGERRRILWSNTCLVGEKGEVRFVISTGVDITERKRAESEKKKLVHDLRERIKELTAMYRTMEIVQQPKPVPELLQEVVSLLPAAWQYPEITAARISYDGQEYRTPGYAGSAWVQSAPFSTCDAGGGRIEVVYLEERPAEAEGPFLAEERNLIDSLAQILAGFLNRRISEKSLQKSEEKYRSLFESMTQLFVLCEIILDDAGKPYDYRYVEANPAVLKYLNLPRERVIGKTLREVTSNIDPYLLEISGRVALTGEPIEIERFGVVGGRWFHLSFDSPRKGYFTVLGTDITERKQAEEALRESEERFRTAFEEGAVAMALTALDSTLLKVNSSFCRMLGFSESELVGRSFTEITHPDDCATNLAGTRRLARGEISSFRMEKRYLRKDGTVVWGDMNTASVPDAKGRPLYCVTHVQDITERKQAEEASERLLHEVNVHAAQLREANERLATANEDLAATNEELQSEIEDRKKAEEALRQSRQRYAAIHDHASFPIVLFKFPEGVIIEVNAAFERSFECSREEAIGKTTVQLGFASDPEARERMYAELVAKGFVRDWEMAYRTRSGRDRLGSFSFERLDIDGQAYHLGIVIDITERKRAEEALREWNATLESKIAQRTAELQHRAKQLQKLTLQLSQAEEQERRRIAVILHEDLQQQIAGARFHLSLVRGRAQEDRQRTDMDAIDAMLRDAIEKSRTLSRDLSPAVLHMNDLAELLQWLANRLRAQQGLSVDLDLSGDMTLHSEVLATFLFRAAQEMLVNVVKHAHVREAAIRVRRIGRCVRLSVSDQGRGFDPQELRETPGFGLFSIRERAEMLGGRMTVKSAEGKGSRLSIVVPDGQPVAVPPPSGASFPLPGAAGVPSNGTLHVLLVDDHDVVRAGLAALLREARGIELVGEASDGREAINMAMELHPNVVIMDVSMPLMSGEEAARQIKVHLPQTRVIALSMYDEAEKKQKMFEAGAEAYILKTVSAEELLAAIRGESHTDSGAPGALTI